MARLAFTPPRQGSQGTSTSNRDHGATPTHRAAR
jgi:hypothetical protein